MEYVKAFVEPLISILVMILIPIVTFYAQRLYREVAKKYNFDRDEKIESWISDKTFESIHYAEKWARDRVKVGESAPEGAIKLQQATQYFADEMKRRGLPALAEDEIKRLIEGHLASMDDGVRAAVTKSLPPPGSN